MRDPEELSLTNLLDGEVVQEFADELRIIAENILDPNTEPQKARKVILEMTITPNKHRDACATRVQVYSKPARCEPRETMLFVGRHHGAACFSEKDSRQGSLFDKETHEVQPMHRVVEGGRKDEE